MPAAGSTEEAAGETAGETAGTVAAAGTRRPGAGATVRGRDPLRHSIYNGYKSVSSVIRTGLYSKPLTQSRYTIRRSRIIPKISG